MDFRKLFTKERIIFIALFSVLVLIGRNINFSPLVGEPNQFFTLFQFFGPIAGAFLGPLFGAVSVLFADLVNFFLVGKEFTLINVVRILPMLFGAYYFGIYRKNKKDFKDVSIIVPLVCIALFILHPVGGTVWFYSLFWLIPVITRLFSSRLFFRSLGATFTAHAVGGAIWIYTVPMPAELWVALIPIVIFERVLFALGITGSYLAMNTVLHKFASVLPAGIVHLDKRYVLSSKLYAKSR